MVFFNFYIIGGNTVNKKYDPLRIIFVIIYLFSGITMNISCMLGKRYDGLYYLSIVLIIVAFIHLIMIIKHSKINSNS